MRPCCFDSGSLRTFYHTDYFRSATGRDGASLLTPEDRALLDRYNAIAESPEMHLDMELDPGDVQLLSNHTVMHARTDYEDYPEPERRRHLLRLWISLPASASLATRLRKERSRAAMLLTTVRVKVSHALDRAGR